MAFHRFEQNIKEKLEKRTLHSSINAWDKLDAKLENVEAKKSNTLFWILSVAACIIGLLLVVPLFFNNDVENTTPIIVDTKTIEKKKIENSIINNEELIAEENLNDSNTLNNLSSDKNITEKPQLVKVNKEQFANTKSERVYKKANEIAHLNKIDEISEKQEKLKTNQLIIEEQIMNDLVVEIKNIKTQNLFVTDDEIDELLNKAQKELAINSIYNEKSTIVDANLLLQDVEEDLDKSFRNKVFEAFKINYENMITAVSERND